jgi:hypothetical protein
MDSWSRSVFGTWDQSEVGGFEPAMRRLTELLATSRPLTPSSREARSHRPVRLRESGELFQINVSLPLTRASAIVIGARYRKQDDSHTEDCFLFAPEPSGFSMVPYYRGSIERDLPEYRRTHKQNADAFDPGPPSWPTRVATDICTITFTGSIGDPSAAPF